MKKNYQKVITYHKCKAGDDEPNCVGYARGSHGDCDYRGTGNDYETCHNSKRLKKPTEPEPQPKESTGGWSCGDGFA